MNSNANIKQFQLIKFINENCDDDHVISKISIVLRRDKIEAPYYMITKIRMSSCIDMEENGLIHAMDMLTHNRKYNLFEYAYREVESLIRDIIDNDSESDLVKIFEEDQMLKIEFMSKNDDEFRSLFESYGELFEKIDSLID